MADPRWAEGLDGRGGRWGKMGHQMNIGIWLALGLIGIGLVVYYSGPRMPPGTPLGGWDFKI